VRTSSLGIEQARTATRAADGYSLALHIYWLPAELVGGTLQIGRMTLDWLSGPDRVLFVDGEATGLTDLRTWYATHAPATVIETIAANVSIDELARAIDSGIRDDLARTTEATVAPPRTKRPAKAASKAKSTAKAKPSASAKTRRR
jgi:hypothetical protein